MPGMLSVFITIMLDRTALVGRVSSYDRIFNLFALCEFVATTTIQLQRVVATLNVNLVDKVQTDMGRLSMRTKTLDKGSVICMCIY